MKALVLAVMILMVLLLVPYGIVLSASQPVYVIQVGNDGSATWTVTQTLDINSSFETLDTLQNKITLLVEASASTTGRAMTASADSLTFTSVSSSYIEAQYKFDWENFSEVEGSQLVIGDVFRTPNFFDRLYGDGEVFVTYPSQFVVQNPVKPGPLVQNDSIQTLEWLGTKDLENGARIVLRQGSAPWNFVDTLRANAVLIVGLFAVAAGSSVVFYNFRRNRKKKVSIPEKGEPGNLPIMENDEEKTVRLIRSSGGSLYQSAITDQLGFSKAKTSQLLTVLEHKGVIRRYKRGRDKIAVLMEENKGEIS